MAYTATNWQTGDVITAERLNNLEYGVTSNDTNITAIGTQIEGLTQKDSDLEQSLATANETIGEHETSIESLTQKDSELESSIDILSETVKILQSGSGTTNETVASIQESVTALENSVGTIETSVSALQEKDTTIESSISALQEKDTELEGSITTLTGQIDSISESVAEHTSELSSLRTKDTELENSVSESASKIAALEYKDTELETTIGENTCAITDLEEKGNTHDESIASLQSLVEAQATTISELQAELEEVRLARPVQTTFTSTEKTLNYPKDNVNLSITNDVTGTLSLTAKSVNVSGDMGLALLKVNAEGDVNLTNLTNAGTVTAQKNICYQIETAGDVSFKNCTFNQTGGYNGMNISNNTGDTKLVGDVTIENVDWIGKLSNNCICVYNNAENAVLTVKGCHMADVSNAIRLSNNSNVPMTLNVENCTFDKWATGDYAGMIILQDYVSESTDWQTNARFSPAKLTINIKNCTGPNGPIQPVDDLHTVIGSGDENQLLYMYVDKGGGLISYTGNESLFPTLNIVYDAE